ncbi:replication initiation factor domain-containing protein [Methylomonas sp. HYX-M1]|uniref:replication initiation factor domain-containing protein n=1 Tax=Methylomonas sp. HYX-M1 TaxID=3139307 RepID=UPI00345C325C
MAVNTDHVLTPEQAQELFDALPKRLRDKIKPPRKLTMAERVKDYAANAARSASITPKKFRTKASLRAHIERSEVGAGGASLPPITNRGGTDSSASSDRLPSIEAKELLKVEAVGKGAKVVFVRVPRPDKAFNGRHSFVDWVNFTFKSCAFPLDLHTGHVALTDHDYVMALSAQLFDVFGFGVTHQRENGLNFYKHAYDLGENGWGFVCIGGQRDSISVTVKGQGLMAAREGWEQRLYDLLQRIPGAKLTRIDLAADNFNSDTSLDDYLAMYHAGLFSNRSRQPNIEQAGNWINPNGKGRTLYIGNRQSGKLLRIYEKGLQLAKGFHEKYPNWVRVELELKNDDRIIPFDALLRPGQYLAGAYPALARFHQVQERVKTYKRQAESTLIKALEVTRHQFGRYIWALVEFYGPETALQKLTHGKEELPKSLEKVLGYQTGCDESECLHTEQIHLETDIRIPFLNHHQGEIYHANAGNGL